MMLWRRLFATRPALSPAGPRDAAAIAALHATAFHRGWSEDEVDGLLGAGNVIAHRALAGSALAGFVISRLAADEAEILSIAVARAQRRQGVAKSLLDLHLRRLVGLGCRAIFLEVDENNRAARRLYDRAGFREVGQRPNYYAAGKKPAAALILRRELG